MKVVVARYNEDVRWLFPIINIVTIYNKGLDDLDYIPQNKIIKCENVGKEGGTYVKHIIDNYDNLDNYTAFIQGEIHDHINHANMIESNNYFSILVFNICRTNCQMLMPLPLICLTLPLTCGRFVFPYNFIENLKNTVLNKLFSIYLQWYTSKQTTYLIICVKYCPRLGQQIHMFPLLHAQSLIHVCRCSALLYNIL
jgi:hypothetical protein